MLDKIIENPTIVNESPECFTSIYFMPACIRALNACAEKVGMDKIIDDISISDETMTRWLKFICNWEWGDGLLILQDRGCFPQDWIFIVNISRMKMQMIPQSGVTWASSTGVFLKRVEKKHLEVRSRPI